MPDLSTLLRLQAGYNDQQMDASGRLMQTIGNMVKERGQRSFQQDAIEFFKDGNISPERLQQFSQMYPNVNPEETWKVAAAVSTQKKAQVMKDAGTTMAEILRTAPFSKLGDPDFIRDKVKAMNLPKDVENEFVSNHLIKVVEFNDDMIKRRREATKGEPIGSRGNIQYDEQGNMMKDKDGKPVIIGAPGETEKRDIEVSYPDGRVDKVTQSEYDALVKQNPDIKRGKQQFAPATPEKEKAPTPSNIVSRHLGKDLWQDYEWNPETKKNDILSGKPYRKKEEKTSGEDKPPSGYRYNKDGTLSYIPGGPADQGIKDIATPERLKWLGDFFAVATGNGEKEPSAADLMLLQDSADKLGYEVVKEDPVTKPGAIFGKAWPDTVKKGGWTLKPKSGAVPSGNTTSPPSGFVDSGRTSGGKKVYVKGTEAWIAP